MKIVFSQMENGGGREEAETFDDGVVEVFLTKD